MRLGGVFGSASVVLAKDIRYGRLKRFTIYLQGQIKRRRSNSKLSYECIGACPPNVKRGTGGDRVLKVKRGGNADQPLHDELTAIKGRGRNRDQPSGKGNGRPVVPTWPDLNV
jgi:hypothetical protein